jgi:hypothetical protein
MSVVAFSSKNFRGKWKTAWYPKTASVVIVKGTPVEWAAGYVKQATTTAGATDTPLAGIYNGPTTASSDSDYASNTLVPVLVPAEPLAEVQMTVSTGSLAATDVGKSFDIDANSSVTVSTTTNEPVTCSKYISATEGLFVLTNISSPAA